MLTVVTVLLRRFHSIRMVFTERLAINSAARSIPGINRHPGHKYSPAIGYCPKGKLLKLRDKL